MDKAQIEQMIIEERRRYARQWRLKNRDRIAEYNRRYWQRRAEKLQKEVKSDADRA